MIRLQHIEMLLAVERAGSIRAASKLLGKTQPAVTKALRQAEADLGAAIFKRAPSGVVVTDEGRAILRRAHVIQSELRKMEEELAQSRGLGTGRLNVTVSPLAAARIITPALKRFRKRFPRIHVQITGGHEPIAFTPVREGQVDVVIGPVPQPDDTGGLAVDFLIETPVAVLTGQSSRWPDKVELADIAEGDWLMIGSRARLPYLQRHFTSRGIAPPEVMVTSDSIVSVLSLVQDSDYLCTYPGLLVAATLPKWRVRALELSDPIKPARIAVITSSERPPTPALQHFCDCVQEAGRAELAEGYSPG